MKKSFTIIEALVAITIFSLGIIYIAVSIWQSYSMASQATERFIAAYLAQEGLEIVKNLRSENYLNERAWNNNLGAGDYEVDYNDDSLFIYQDRYLMIDSAGFYNYESGNPTIFKRKISISYPAQDQMKVTVTVFWPKKGLHQEVEQFSVTEILYNWNQ